MNKNKKSVIKGLTIGTVVVLTGCAATQTAIEHGSLNVSTKQSQTIFLDPVSTAQKTVFVSVKNTSDEEIDIASPLTTALGISWIQSSQRSKLGTLSFTG